jgi:hypothetical protein
VPFPCPPWFPHFLMTVYSSLFFFHDGQLMDLVYDTVMFGARRVTPHERDDRTISR